MMRMPYYRLSVKLLICSLFTLLIVNLLFSCKKSDKVTTASPVISFRQKVISIPEDVPMMPVKPDSTGGAITEFNINPLLPKGLVLNKANGEISGMPSDTLAPTKFIVTAKGPGGMASDTITMLIGTVGFSYGSNPTFTLEINSRDLSTTPLSPVVLAGNFTQYVISSPFPDSLTIKTGLTFNQKTGQIGGTPKNLTSTTENPVPAVFTITGITANNKAASTTLSIFVNDKKPNFTYPFSGSFAANNSVGSVLTPSVSTISTIKKYRLAPNSPALPAGLTMDTTTGKITGTPLSAGNVTIVVRGINSGGYTDVNLPLVITSGAATPDVRYMMSFISGNVVDTICPRILSGNTIYLTKSDNIGNTSVVLNPVATAGQVGTFSVSPALPTGMSLSPSGITSGTPSATGSTGSSSSTVTINNAIAGNPAGSFNMNMVVNSPFFIYKGEVRGFNPNIFLFLINQKIDETGNGYTGYSKDSLAPVVQGGSQIVSYAIYAVAVDKPFAKTGLTFNTTTGAISGTPVITTDNNGIYTPYDYVVVGTKADGSFTYYKIRLKIYPNMGVYGQP